MLTGLVILVVLVLCTIGAVLYGASRWRTGTRELRARLEAAAAPIKPATHDARETESLPLPVKRYFRRVLKEDQPLIAAVRVGTKENST